MVDTDCAMVFLPLMEQLKLNIKSMAPNQTSAELLISLKDSILSSVTKPPYNISD